MDEQSQLIELGSGFKLAKPTDKCLLLDKRVTYFSSNKLDDVSGIYIWVLKENAYLPMRPDMPVPVLSKVVFKGVEYKVIYVGLTEILKTRLNSHHYKGNVHDSKLRLSLAILFGFTINKNGKQLYVTSQQEDYITNWLKNNCMVFLHEYSNVEKYETKYISLLNPPFNCDKCDNAVNKEFREYLSKIINDKK